MILQLPVFIEYYICIPNIIIDNTNAITSMLQLIIMQLIHYQNNLKMQISTYSKCISDVH